MKTLFPLALGLILFAAACGSGTESTAATVNGFEISQADVKQEMSERGELYLEDPVGYEFFEAYGSFVSGDEASASTDLFREVLSRQILFQLIAEEVEARGGTITEEDAANARSQVEAVYPSFLSTPYHQREVTRFENAMALTRLLTEGGTSQTVEEVFEQMTALGDTACASHILVATLDEANAIIAELDGGASFEDIAVERSLDPGSGAAGGSLGCSSASRYVPPFAAAVLEQPVGVVGPPVESDFGFHIIRVDERPQPLDDELRASIEAQIQSQGPSIESWIGEQIGTAAIDIDESYGVWDSAGGRVIDPALADAEPES